MLRILLANKFFYSRGGDCIHTIQLKKLLEKQGHEVAVFSMEFPENIKNPYSEYWPSEVSFEKKSPKNLLVAIQRPFGVKEVEMKWNNLLNDFQPDVIHLQNIHSQLSPVIAQLAHKKNIPVVWTLHDYKLLCPAYTFRDSSGAVCEDCLTNSTAVIKKKCVKGSLIGSTLGYLEGKKWDRETLQQITKFFISPSFFLRKKMIQGGFAEKKIKHLYNFAEEDKFRNPIISQRKLEVIYVGRISPEKGVETLCKAFQEISSVNLIIIGDGPLKLELEKRFASDKIQFIGFQPWDVIKEKLSQAAFMVIPSEWYENNPLTMIESFSLGTPVLGAEIGGIPELIEDGINGITFQAGDIHDLKAKIQKMLDYKFWNYKQIQNHAKSKFSAQNYYEKLLVIYNKAISDVVH